MRKFILPLLVLAVLAFVGYAVWSYFDVPAPAQPLAQAPEIVDVPKETIQSPVVTYAPKAKKRLHLPAPVIEDDTKRVTAASKVDTGDRTHTITAVLDTHTGETTLYDRPDPLPWLGTRARTEIGVYTGIRDFRQMVTRVAARHEFMQAKQAHVGLVANADFVAGQGMSHYEGVGIWIQF